MAIGRADEFYPILPGFGFGGEDVSLLGGIGSRLKIFVSAGAELSFSEERHQPWNLSICVAFCENIGEHPEDLGDSIAGAVVAGLVVGLAAWISDSRAMWGRAVWGILWDAE